MPRGALHMRNFAEPRPGSPRIADCRRSRSEQNAKLYSQPGQFNPHAAREERKRRKRAGKDPALAGERPCPKLHASVGRPPWCDCMMTVLWPPAGDDSDFDFDAE